MTSTIKVAGPAILALLMTAACPPPPPPETGPQKDPPGDAPPPARPELPTWLLGAWHGERGGVTTEERWWRLHDNLMVGLNRTSRGGQEIAREHLQIHKAGDRIIYTAWPSGQQATRFAMTRAAPGLARFENPAHDFPRVLSYSLKAGTLMVEIQGVDADGAPRRASWGWRKGLAGAGSSPPDPIVKSAVVQAPLEQVWQAWTTAAGVHGFFASSAKVEARPGGAYEMYFMQDAPAGTQGSEGCIVVALEPNRSIAFTWNFPPNIPALRDAHTLVTVNLEAAGDLATKVTLTHTGFQPGADWKKGRGYFDEAWETVLDRLNKHFNKSTTTNRN